MKTPTEIREKMKTKRIGKEFLESRNFDYFVVSTSFFA